MRVRVRRKDESEGEGVKVSMRVSEGARVRGRKGVMSNEE